MLYCLFRAVSPDETLGYQLGSRPLALLSILSAWFQNQEHKQDEAVYTVRYRVSSHFLCVFNFLYVFACASFCIVLSGFSAKDINK